MSIYGPAILNGLTLISILMLVAVGLAIIYGLMGVINLAHGEFVTIGAYTFVAVQSLGGGFWIALLAAPVVGYWFGRLIERSLIRRLLARPVAIILVTWGISLVIQQLIQISFGSSPQPVTSPFPEVVSIFGQGYPAYRLFLMVIALGVMTALAIAFRYSRLGMDIRAAIQDPEMAASLGINVKQLQGRVFGMGAALAALGGVLVAPLTVVIAQMGVNYLAKSFFVVLVGGTGGMGGVALGSTLVGGLETALSYAIPITVAQAAVLVFAVVILRFRPNGLLSK